MRLSRQALNCGTGSRPRSRSAMDFA
jgi:hypothetical protein